MDEKVNSGEVADYYNKFSSSQVKTGANLRHYTLINELIRHGLRRDSNILEIGCGVGVFTSMIASFATRGNIVATDISGESVELARARTGFHKSMKFFTTDMSDFAAEMKFDFIVLADVLEHIPFEAYGDLFTKLAGAMHEGSIIFASVPNPSHLEFLHREQPEKLQIIDQPVHTDILSGSIYAAGIVLLEQKALKIFHTETDYTLFIMTLKPFYKAITEISTLEKITKKLFRRMKYNFALIKG